MSTTITDRYLMHPVAASGQLADGDPLDAGTAHIVHHDVTILQQKNLRLVAHAVGFGEIDHEDDDWDDVLDASEVSDAGALAAFPWARERCGWVCGPIALAHTRLSATPAGYHPRKLKVIIQAHKSGDPSSTLTLLAALTATADPPTVGRVIASATASRTDADSGAWTEALTLAASEVVRPASSWTCRGDTSTEPAQVAVADAWVWVGWRSDTMGTPDRIDSISVFEVST